jgi:GNAT superfamily N-acetyltransferase
MNKFKRLTQEYQQELQQTFPEKKVNKKPRTKITVEPFTVDAKYFDPKKHDFTVKATKDGEQLGFIAVTHKKQGIMPFQFEVEKEYRRKKIGTKLAEHAEQISKKNIIPSPDMTEDAKKWHDTWLKAKSVKIKKEEIKLFLQDLIKSESYAKKASTGVILLHPISLSGKTHRSDGVPMHMTVKFFGDNSKINPQEIQKHLEKFSIPNSINENKLLFMPHKLPAADGGVHHVLLAYGAPPHIDHIREGSAKYGPYLKNFLPHISIDKEDWEKFSKMGPVLTADKIGLKIHSAQLKSGNEIVKEY